MSSYWIESTKDKTSKFNELDKDINADVCIIGAGITGISLAYELSKYDMNIVVLDRQAVCSSTSGNTTAKITSGHDLFYKYLIDSFSENKAKQYLHANERAIRNIENIVKLENIDCDFEIKNNYIFTRR